jgi:uncharacterized protein involved in exopolysaccharide biosynthesis
MELRKYWEVFWRRRRLFALITGVIVIFTLIWALSATHIYKATTKVFIKMQDTTTSVSSIVPSSLGKLDSTTSGNVAGTIREMVENKDSLNRVIEDLKLLKRNGTPLSPVELLNSGSINLYLNKTAVKVSQVTDSDVIEIMGFSKDPALAVKISNTVASNFLNMLENLNREEIGKTIAILEKETLRLKNMVEDSEETVKRYKVNNKAVNIDEKATSYTTQLVTAELSIIKMSIEKKDEHPDLKAALEQIAAIKNELKDIPTRQIELSRLQRINTAMLNVYTTLLSDLEKAKVIKAMSITNMQVIEKARIPDMHKKNYIYFPKKKRMLLIALIIGSFFGVVAVFFAEYIDDTIKGPKELKAWTGQKVLATIPLLKTTNLFPPKESTDIFNAVSDLWLSIKIDAKNQGNEKHPRMLTITSYGEKEGKSLVAANLGLLLSRNGQKTLIIDFNLSTPFLSELYTGSPGKKQTEKGLADFVAAAGENKADNAQIFKKLAPNLFFLPTGLAAGQNIAFIKNSPYLSDLIAIARNEFDVIIVDSSP